MAVKDLVGLYESSPATSRRRSPRDVLNNNDSIPKDSSSAPAYSLSTSALPPPSPARFIQNFSHRKSSQEVATSNSSTDTPDDYSKELDNSVDITTSTTKENNPFLLTRKETLFDSPSDDEHRSLLVRDYHLPHDSSTTSLAHKMATSSSMTLVNRRPLLHHSPIPATVVFSRHAAPLHLPKLDNHLASLRCPSFPSLKRTDTESAMFPPMDKLVASGQSIEDLENNVKVTPAWRNRKSILGSAVNLMLGVMGSSALSTFYSLQGLSNTVQVFALILSTIVPLKGQHLEDKWRQLFLGTIPNILAFNFASTLVQSLFFLLIFMAVASGLLYYFWRSSFHCDRYNVLEGLQAEPKSNRWGVIIVTFLLTVIYLPLSTMAVHILVWSDDLWVVDNPYTNATSFPPIVPPLGPASEYRDPLDFCWTTTMKRNEVNYAPVIITLSAVVFLALTVWFPIALRRVIKLSVPKVDPFTELGRPRNKADMDNEYHRLLDRDRNPFAFLYNNFRRGWADYQSTYLFAKFSTLLLVAVIDPNNCFFRSLSRTRVPIVRQILLLISTVGFFSAQSFFAPFLDPINNASEWTSRLNYILTSAVALGVALNIPGKDVFNTYVLYVIYVVTYGLSFYFTIINLGIAHRVVKRLTRRIDFSIDIFSPRLDLSPTSIHTKRRIWQESITTLLLTSPECQIPETQSMTFAQARDSEFPPYLLDFAGSPGERHVENLKILREIGSAEFKKAVHLVYSSDYARYKYLEEEIQSYFIGPDCYWKDPSKPLLPGCTRFFGNAWWIPFPPTLVIRYDDGPLAVLRAAWELERYVAQNSSPDISRRREVRMALRALDGQIVAWPYDYITPIGAHSTWCCGSRYNAKGSVHFKSCVFRIKRRGHLIWQDLQLGSGFDVELTYAKGVQIDGDIIGLNDDYDLTSPLARFLTLNRKLIPESLAHLEHVLSDYRSHHRRDCHRKNRVLTYRFLSFVYDQPREPTGLAESSIEFERDLRVRQLMVGSEAVFEAAYGRLAAVQTTETATWWYIFWDDLWRRNHDTIGALELHSSDFNPYYPSSIAYTPLPRPALESFLIQRGLLSKPPQWGDFFHSGFLNKLYLRLNDTVFRGSSRAVMFHYGGDVSELDMEDVDMDAPGQPSTLGTGPGTDHDDSSIRARPAYRWENLLALSPRKRKRRIFSKMGAWFGLTPLWTQGTLTEGVSLDVSLENGRYVLMDNLGSSIHDLHDTKMTRTK